MRQANVNSSQYLKPNMYKSEGIDHLNINVLSAFKVCRALDPYYMSTLKYDPIGSFKSVQALSVWLRSSDMSDDVRRMKGYKLKEYLRTKVDHSKRVPNYRAILAVATWIKLQSNIDEYKAELLSLPDNLDLLSYLTIKPTGIRITAPSASIFISIAKELMSAMIEDRIPDFSLFADYPSKSKDQYLELFLSSI